MKKANDPAQDAQTENPPEEDTTYELTIDLQVLKHLGIGLYSNVPAVISEMVANAYDADATKVEITVKEGEIIIEDDGLGMNVDDANKKFLTVGYDKRGSGETATPKYKRKPMGRKGIGKLSAFAIAGEVEVRSIKTDPKTEKELGRAAFVMDVAEIEKKAKDKEKEDVAKIEKKAKDKEKEKKKEPYHPRPLDASDTDMVKGTRIVLRTLKKKGSKKRNVSPDYIRINLARRFSVFGKTFRVLINGNEVSPADRQYWDKLQFVWGLGDGQFYELARKGKKVRRNEALTDVVKVPGQDDETVSGWIGTVHLPRELKDGTIDNNGIVVMARGKLVHENLLPFARTARIFAEYVVGEINADWMDDDTEDDMATSDRQSLKEDDARFLALQSYVKERLDQIAARWDEWRKEVGLKDAVERHPVLQEWLDIMTPDNRKQAEKLISTIEGMPVADEEDKRELLKHGIMAFETLALKGNLAVLSETPIFDAESLKNIMSAMEDLEIAHYYQAAKIRWTVLREFEKLVDQNAKEKFAQDHIYQNTWLIDTAWEMPTNDIRKEKKFTDKLKAKRLGLNRNVALSRYDIKYLTVSGKDLIVELKRSGASLTVSKIIDQVRKYAEIMKALAKESRLTPNFEIIVLLGNYPAGYTKDDENALKNYNARIETYETLIEHARATYGDFLERQTKIDRIQKMVDSL